MGLEAGGEQVQTRGGPEPGEIGPQDEGGLTTDGQDGVRMEAEAPGAARTGWRMF